MDIRFRTKIQVFSSSHDLGTITKATLAKGICSPKSSFSLASKQSGIFKNNLDINYIWVGFPCIYESLTSVDSKKQDLPLQKLFS